ncbi:MAG TPA: hypothetical protein VEF89_13045 [Solirubrobacteraceae bacterium]|nr:hypothetical protein [Solirubrobacteraceae bacterium]
MVTIVVRAILRIAAVVGLIVVPEHAPQVLQTCPNGEQACVSTVAVHTGLSQATYDVLRITTWTFVIVGVLLVTLGLVSYARPEVRPRG